MDDPDLSGMPESGIIDGAPAPDDDRVPAQLARGYAYVPDGVSDEFVQAQLAGDRPVGITVTYDNGDVEPVVEVVYRGRDGRGIARWRAGVVPAGRKVVSLSVEHLPGKTGVELVSISGEDLA